MFKNIALGLLMFAADILISAVIKTVSGSSAPKQLIEGLVEKIAESDDPPAKKWQHVTELIEEARRDMKDDLDKLPDSLRNLVIELAVTRAKARVGELGSR